MEYNDAHKIYVTSDTHFGHTKTITQFIFRPFTSAEEMDKKMVENWNDIVKPKDTVIHLGDFSFQNPQNYVSRLNGQIHIIPGNHDRLPRLKRAGFACIRDAIWHFKFIHGDEKKEVVLCHYPMLSWNKKRYGVPHLYGHMHTGSKERENNLLFQKGSYDVGVDNNDYKPLDILEAIKKCTDVIS